MPVTPRAIPVLFVLPEHTLMLDLAGPAEALRLASQLDPGDVGAPPPRFDLRYVGPAASIATSIGLALTGIASLPDALPPGAIVMLVGASSNFDTPASTDTGATHATVTAWLKRVVAPASDYRLLCVCSGALIAAGAGLLDGRDCTTHHSLCDALRTAAPTAKILENRLYVADGHVSTSAGITAGIDMVLHMLAGLAGPRVACAVARDMVIYMRRGGGDPQLSPWLSGRNHLHPALHRVQDALGADPTRDWSLTQMAQIACSSTRHLTRLFHAHTDGSPLDHLQRLRVAMARELLAQSSLDMETVAGRAGFGSARHLRRVWRKYYTTPPSNDRRTGIAGQSE